MILENPKENIIYRRCKDDIQEKFVTQEKLVEVMVPCFVVSTVNLLQRP